MKKICVLGLGFIGLPTACMLASKGKKVIGVDIERKKVELINKGKCYIKEARMEKLLKNVINSKNFIAKTKVEKADVFIICTPTPLDKKTKKCNLNYVKPAVKMILNVLEKGNLVILESTVPIGTTENIAKFLEKKTGLKAGKDFFIAYCPERAIPGNLLYEIQNNDRIIGGINKDSAEMTKKLYETFVNGNIYLTDSKTAEMTKLVENIFRDVNIALANELAKICDEVKLNVWDVIELANKHPRVNLHKPGPGVGGHCLPFDAWFLAEKTKQANIITLARKINDSMAEYIVNKIRKIVRKGKISILGVAYKGNVNDTRESPGKKIIKLLKEKGYEVSVYDPIVSNFEYKLNNLKDAVKNSSCIIIVADHEIFKAIDPKEIGKLMKEKIIFDTKNCIDLEKWRKEGFRTILLGASY